MRGVHGTEVHRRKKPRESEKEAPPVRTEASRPAERSGKNAHAEKSPPIVPRQTDQKIHVAAPVPPPASPEKESTDPPPKLPRFAALKTDETNMRKGPGQRYPIEWVFKRRDLPLEVEREYDVWRYVRDPDGVEGWVHQVTLSDRRTFMVKDTDATVRSEANDTAHPVALLKAGVIGRLRSCDDGSQWCEVQVADYKGYLRRDQFWGALPGEVVVPP
jgi:SH3-like domain-containing protein